MDELQPRPVPQNLDDPGNLRGLHPDISPTSADDPRIPAEYGRGIFLYKRALNLKDRALAKLLRGNVVLDLGSGNGNFAAEIERERITSNSRLVFKQRWLPQRIDSLNIRYGMPDYEEFRSKEGISTLDHSDRGTSPQEEEKLQKQAWEKARENFLGLDWNDLSSIQSNTYNTIISVFGFPFYSDMHYDKTAQIPEGKQYNEITFGENAQQVYRELGRILKPEGRMMLLTSIPYLVLQSDTVALVKLQQTLSEGGHTFSVAVLPGVKDKSAWDHTPASELDQFGVLEIKRIS